MAKTNNLPSIDDDDKATETITRKQQPSKPDPVMKESIGYVSRTVDVRMTGSQPVKFKRIMRYLEDSGKTLCDGTPVTNKRRAALWLIENFDIPKASR